MKNLKYLIIAILFVPVLVLAQTADVTSTNNSDAQPVQISETDTDESVENLKQVTDTIEELNKEAKIAESESRNEIRNALDKNITNIVNQTDLESYRIHQEIDDTRQQINNDISDTIKNSSITDETPITGLQDRVDTAIDEIESRLEEFSGVEIDLSESKRSIRNTLLKYQEVIAEKKDIIENRDGDLLERDTDNDGLSDYDEKYIYETDPENANTAGGELNDSEKVAAGINPKSETGEKIDYQDPRTDKESFVSKLYKVERVELVKKETGEKTLAFKGTALPNSFITLYIYSTPVIVTVKTDARGEWSYELNKELENGDHQVYVATVNNTGRLIARSESIPFTKTAEAAALGSFGIGDPTPAQNDFIQENFILIVLAILLFAIIITLILTGNKKKELDEIIGDTDTADSPNANTGINTGTQESVSESTEEGVEINTDEEIK
jgi:hypothetical protein